MVLMFALPSAWGQLQAPSSSILSVNALQNGSIDSIMIDKSSENKPILDHLTIISDSKLDNLLEVYRDERNLRGVIDGYRVHIFTGKKDDAYRIKSRFLNQYPDLVVHINFFAPDFYVRVGDFRTRSEAIKLKYLIAADYPDPFIVESKIEYPKLLTNNE
jgi:hypothetical protein